MTSKYPVGGTQNSTPNIARRRVLGAAERRQRVQFSTYQICTDGRLALVMAQTPAG
jgi:hypothetical protein